jgi:hypothetical protein
MLNPDDEFDLDVRLTGQFGVAHDSILQRAPGLFDGEWRADDRATIDGDCGPTDGCTADCWTAGCNTSETCDNPMCGSDAITFGSYCIDDSGDDTCNACPGGPGEPPDSPDIPDTRGRWCP